jgi:hypothetical protein
MPNGRPGDNPLTDLLTHDMHPFSPRLETLIRQLHGLDPSMFGLVQGAEFDWASGLYEPEAFELLNTLITAYGDAPQCAKAVRQYKQRVYEHRLASVKDDDS